MDGPLDLVVVGGCGHVGLPLALSLADCGYKVGIDDIDAAKVAQVKAGNVPFLEKGAEELLRKLLPGGRLELAVIPAPRARKPVAPRWQRRLVEARIEQKDEPRIEPLGDQATEQAPRI